MFLVVLFMFQILTLNSGLASQLKSDFILILNKLIIQFFFNKMTLLSLPRGSGRDIDNIAKLMKDVLCTLCILH